MRLVFDMEADNLLYRVTRMWCIVAKDIDTGEIYRWTPDALEAGLSFLSKAEVLIGHNIIGYDLPVFQKLHNFTYFGELFDTLVVSRLQYPDRPRPANYVGKAVHSVEAWGMRFGLPKPPHEDWSQFSEEMLHRCEQDVLITERIYKYLLEEAKK